MSHDHWPDHLKPPDPAYVQTLLDRFWPELSLLADLLPRGEVLLAAEATTRLRQFVLEMMLALNGIARPQGTRHLTRYLSPSQRAALEKTLVAPSPEADSWLGQAVALVVIYRWYAPQLVDKYGLSYPDAAETQTWAGLQAALPGWPQTVTTA